MSMDFVVACNSHRLGVSQHEILGLSSRQRPQVWTRVELDRGERYVRFHRAGLVERTGNCGSTLQEPVERQFLAQMRARRQVVQSSERHAWDFNMRLTRDNLLPCATRRYPGLGCRPNSRAQRVST